MLIYCKLSTHSDGYLGVVCSHDYVDSIDDVAWLKLRCDGKNLFVRQRGYDTFDSPTSRATHHAVLLRDLAIQNAVELEFASPPGPVDGKFLSSNDCHSISLEIQVKLLAIDFRHLESVHRLIHKLAEFENLVAAPELTTPRLSDEIAEYFQRPSFERGQCIPVVVGAPEQDTRGVLVLDQAGESIWSGTLHLVDSEIVVTHGTHVYAWRNNDEPVLIGNVWTAISSA